MESTRIVYLLRPYLKNISKRTIKSPKIYFTDTALARFIAGQRGPLHKHTSPFGRAVEGFVVNELFKQVEYLGLGWKLSYFRTKTGLEADVIISAPQGKIAAEIKATDKLAPKDIKGIQSLMAMDKDIKSGVVFSLQARPISFGPRISNFPIWNL